MHMVISFLVSMATVALTVLLLPGVYVDGVVTLAIVVVVLAVVNATLGALLKIISLPITVMTFGAFALVINAALVMLVAALVEGFTVDGFGSALIFSIVLTVVDTIVNALSDKFLLKK